MAPPAAQDPEPSDLTGTRGQALQRLQVGVGGLAAMVLLVGLASTILQQARQADDPAAPVAGTAPKDKAGDPLVDIGVVPELPNDDVAVPDLPAEQIVTENPGQQSDGSGDASEREQ